MSLPFFRRIRGIPGKGPWDLKGFLKRFPWSTEISTPSAAVSLSIATSDESASAGALAARIGLSVASASQTASTEVITERLHALISSASETASTAAVAALIKNMSVAPITLVPPLRDFRRPRTRLSIDSSSEAWSGPGRAFAFASETGTGSEAALSRSWTVEEDEQDIEDIALLLAGGGWPR